MNRAVEVVGFLIGTLLLADALDIFIVGLQFPVFSLKWWALCALTALILYYVLIPLYKLLPKGEGN